MGASSPSLLGAPGAPPIGGAGPVIGKTGGNVALLLPLSGPLASIGQSLENAAKLAFPANAPGGPVLDIRDTGGTPAGAASAAQAAIAAGDGIILGPLTSGEAHAVMPIAQGAGVNMLAFTNDSTVAAPGVWALGVTPTQQVTRVLQAAADAGRNQVAGLLPDTDFGHRLGDAIRQEAATLGEPMPQLTFYEASFSSVNQAVRQLSDFGSRGQSIENQIKRARERNDAAGRAEARRLQHEPIPPPSFNALFIGATKSDTLAELANFLPYYDVNPPQVQFMGPALWSDLAPAMAHQTTYLGALYAAPDPAGAAAFDQKYQSAYGAAPPAIADVAFDAAAIAKLASGAGGFTSAVLSAPAGFIGTDGVLVLDPDGQVQRGLAVYKIAPGAPEIASPAPQRLGPAAAPPTS
ncbi:MAG: penicillin-binding protein activator [Rhodospirillales bacterium 20-64-7]|nr:MAG: penicillin-binding protein activator [Rhodospirillales bacterium 20-64-7]